jgi:hypothetical protein
MFTAIRLASSRVSSLAADRLARCILEIDIGELLAVVVAHCEARLLLIRCGGESTCSTGSAAATHQRG